MTYGKTIDIEDALRLALADAEVDASAPPIPADLGSTLPWICIERTGGADAGDVLDAHAVDLDVYADSEAAAIAEAGEICGWVRDLAGRELEGGVPCYRAAVTALPYLNPDPRHPTLARYTVKVQILTRTGA